MKVEDFVRTKDGVILKIYNFEDITTEDNIYIGRVVYDKDCCFVYESEIIKSSPYIIDLIEVGDYVNGYKVGCIDDCKGAMRQFHYDDENPNDDVGHWEEEIESVVTHEQFSQMEYRIGE